MDKANGKSRRMSNSKLTKTNKNYKAFESENEQSGVSKLKVKRSIKSTVEIPSPTRKSNRERDNDTDQPADNISNKTNKLHGQDRKNDNFSPSENKTENGKKSRIKDRIDSAVSPPTSRYNKSNLREKSKFEAKNVRNGSPRKSDCSNKMSPSKYKNKTKIINPESKDSSEELSPEHQSTNYSSTLFTKRAIQKGKSSPKMSVSDSKILVLKTGYSRKKSPDSFEYKRGEKAENQSCKDTQWEKFRDSELEKGYVSVSRNNFDSSNNFQKVDKESGTFNEKSEKSSKNESAKQAESEQTKKVVDLREKLRLKRQLKNHPELCESKKEVAHSKRRLSDEELPEDVKRQKLDEVTDLHDCKKHSDVETIEDEKEIIQTETQKNAHAASSLLVNRNISFEKDQKKVEAAIRIKEKFKARKITYSETESDTVRDTLTSRYRKNIEQEKESKSEVERLKRLMDGTSAGVEINIQVEKERENQTNDEVIGTDTELNDVFTQNQSEIEAEIDVTTVTETNDVFHENEKNKLPEKLEKSSEVSDSSILYSNIGEVTLDLSAKSHRSDSFDAEIFRTSTADNISVASNSSFHGVTEKLIVNNKSCNIDNMSVYYPAEVTSTVDENFPPKTEVVYGFSSSLDQNDEGELVAVNKKLVVEANTDTSIVSEIDRSKSNSCSHAVDENFPTVNNIQDCNMYDKISNADEVKHLCDIKNYCDTSGIENDNLRTEIFVPHDSVSDNLVEDNDLSKSCKKRKKHKKHKKDRKRNKSKSADYNSSYSMQSSESNVEDSELDISAGKDSVDIGKDLVQDQSVNSFKHSSFGKSPSVLMSKSAEKSDSLCRSSKARTDVYRGVISETISSRTSNSIDSDDFFLSPDRPVNTRRRSKEKCHSKTSAYNSKDVGSELPSNMSKKSSNGDTDHEGRELELTKTSGFSADETDNVPEESAYSTTDSTEETTLSVSSSAACMSSSDSNFGSKILTEKTSSVSASNLTESSYSSYISSSSSSVSTSTTSVDTEENKERVSSVSELFPNIISNDDIELEIIPSVSKEVKPEKGNAIEKPVIDKGCDTEKDIKGKVNSGLHSDDKEHLTDKHMVKCIWDNHRKNYLKRRRHITDSCVTRGKIKGNKVMKEHALSSSSVAFFDRSRFLQCLLSEITCIVDNTQRKQSKTHVKKWKTGTQNISKETVRTELHVDNCGMYTNGALKVSSDLAKPALSALQNVDLTKHNKKLDMMNQPGPCDFNEVHLTEHKTIQAKDLEHSDSYQTNEVDMMAHKTDESTYLENSVLEETTNEVDMTEHSHADSVVDEMREAAMSNKAKDIKNLETAASCKTTSEIDTTKHNKTNEGKCLQQSTVCISDEGDMGDKYKTNEIRQPVSSPLCETKVSSPSCETSQVDTSEHENQDEMKGLKYLGLCTTNEENITENNKSMEYIKLQSFKGKNSCSYDEKLIIRTNEIAPEELVFGSWTGLSVATSQSHAVVNKAVTSHSEVKINHHSDSSLAKYTSVDSEMEMNNTVSSEESEIIAGNDNRFQVQNANNTNGSQNHKIILEDNSIQAKTELNPFFEIDEQPAFLTTAKPECKDSNLSLRSLKSSISLEMFSSVRKNDEQSGYTADSEDDVNDAVGMVGVSEQAEYKEQHVDYDKVLRKRSSPRKVAMIKRISPVKIKSNVGQKLIKEKQLFNDKNPTKTFIGSLSSPEKLPRTPEKSFSADSVLSSILNKNIASNVQQLKSPPKVSKTVEKQADLSELISYSDNNSVDPPDMLHKDKDMLVVSSRSKLSSGEKFQAEKVTHKKKGSEKENSICSTDTKGTCSTSKQRDCEQESSKDTKATCITSKKRNSKQESGNDTTVNCSTSKPGSSKQECSKDTKVTCTSEKQRDSKEVLATGANSKAVDISGKNKKKQFQQTEWENIAEIEGKNENLGVSVNNKTNQKTTGFNSGRRNSTFSKSILSDTVQKNQISDKRSPLKETIKLNTEDSGSSEIHYERISNEKLVPIMPLRRSPRKMCKVANTEIESTTSVLKDNASIRKRQEHNKDVKSTSRLKTNSVLSTGSFESKCKSAASLKTTKDLLKTPSKSASDSKTNLNDSIDESPAKHTRSATKLNAVKAAVPSVAEKSVASPDKTIPRDSSVESKCKKNLIFTKDKPARKTKLDAIAKQNDLYKQITSLSCSSKADRNKKLGHKTEVNRNGQVKDTDSGCSFSRNGNEMLGKPRSNHSSKTDTKASFNDVTINEIDARKSQGHTDLHRVNRKLTSAQRMTEKNSVSLKSKTQLKETEFASGTLMKTKKSKHASKLCDEKHKKMLKKTDLGTSKICDNFSETGLSSELTEVPEISFAQKLFEYESHLEKKSNKTAVSKRSCTIQNKEKKQIQPHKRKVTSQKPHEVSVKNCRIVSDECQDEIYEKRNSEVNTTTQDRKLDDSDQAEVDALKSDHKTCAVEDEISYSYNKDIEKQHLAAGSKCKKKFSRKDCLDSNTRKTVMEDCKASKGGQNSKKKCSEICFKPTKDVVLNSDIGSDSDSDSATDSIKDEREANLIRSVFGSSDSSEDSEISKINPFSKHVKMNSAQKDKLHTDGKTFIKGVSVDKHPISKHASKRHSLIESSMHSSIHVDSSSNNAYKTDTVVSNASKKLGRHFDFEEMSDTDGYSNCEKFTLSLDEQFCDSESSVHINRLKGSKPHNGLGAFDCSNNDTFSTATIRSTSGTLLLDIDDTMDNTDYVDSMVHEKSLISNNSKSDQSFQETLSQSSNAENNQETVQSTESKLLNDWNESLEEGEVTSSDDEFPEKVSEETAKRAAEKGSAKKKSGLGKVFSPVKLPAGLRNNRQESLKKTDKMLTKSFRISEASKDCDSVSEKKRGQIRPDHEKICKETTRRERSCSYSPSRHAISHSPNVGHEQRHMRSRHTSGETIAVRRQRSDSRSRNTRRSRSHSPRRRHRHQSRSHSRSPKRHYHRSRSRSRDRRDYPRSRHRSPDHHQSAHKFGSRRHRSPSPVTPQRSRRRNSSNRRYKSRSPDSPYLSRRSTKQHEHSHHHSLSSMDKNCTHKSRQHCISEEKEVCSCSCKHMSKPDREHTSKSNREHTLRSAREHTSRSEREHTSKSDREPCSCSKCQHSSKSDTRKLEQRHSPECHSRYSHRHSESAYKKRKRRSCSYSDSGRSRSRSRSKDKHDHKTKRQRANLSRHCDYTSDENDSSELDRSHD